MPTVLDEVADVLVVGALRMFEYIVAVIAAEAMQGLLRCQIVQLGKGEHFAGAVVLPGFVLQFSVAECAGGEVVMRLDHCDGVLEGDVVGCGCQGLQELFHERCSDEWVKGVRYCIGTMPPSATFRIVQRYAD